MGKVLLLASMAAVVLAALGRPWVGVAAYYLLAILSPQHIWWWHFEGLRVSLWVALATFAGVAFKMLSNELDFTYLKTRLNFWLLLLWICINFSYFLGPYVPLYNFPTLTPRQILTVTNNMFLFYFCAALVASKPKSLNHLGFIFVLATIYMTYWANDQYLSQNWAQFFLGRLEGPKNVYGGSLYGDSNAFAILFVTGIPFLFYFGSQTRTLWKRCCLWGIIPLSAHAVFLTGSRGGLLGLALVISLLSLKLKSKAIALLLLLMAVAFFSWQGGQVMQERSQTIVAHEGDSSVESRLAAWKVGLRMVASHPLTGVGLGSFVTAAPLYSDLHAMVAHNTFIHLSAESGALAGLAYLMIIAHFFFNSRRISAWCDENENLENVPSIRTLNNASSASFAGLIVCSLFLSLTIFEIFFFLLIFNNGLAAHIARHQPEQAQPLLSQA